LFAATEEVTWGLASTVASEADDLSKIEGLCDSRRYFAATARQASRTRVQNQRRTINGATEFCDYSCRAICVLADASTSSTAATCRLSRHAGRCRVSASPPAT
jgi:hypothetical protein